MSKEKFAEIWFLYQSFRDDSMEMANSGEQSNIRNMKK